MRGSCAAAIRNAHRIDAPFGAESRRTAATLVRALQHPRQLLARADAELPVDVLEMALDRLLGHEEGLRDLAVRKSLGGERGDAALADRERVGAGEDEPARARAARAQLRPGALDERVGAAAMGEIEAPAQGIARVDAPPFPSQL